MVPTRIMMFMAIGLVAVAPIHAQTKPDRPMAKVLDPSKPEPGSDSASVNVPRRRFRVGERVQVYYRNWYPATIMEIGKGDYRGFYRVDFDDFDRHRWVDADEMKDRPPGTKAKGAFLAGVYNCYSRKRPKPKVLVDVLHMEEDGEYWTRDYYVRKGRYILGRDDAIILRGGGMHDAKAHMDETGQIHLIRTGRKVWLARDPKEMFCVEEKES